MASAGLSRDSIENAITPDRVAGLQDPKPDGISPWRNHSRTHSRNISEEFGLLQSPLNVHEHHTTTSYRYEHPRREKRKIPQWAGIPQSLDREKKEQWRDWGVDFFMMILAIPFLVLAGIVIQVNGKPVGVHQDGLRQCILVTATIFPFLFSVIVGRATIKLATWKLERGTTLGLLEKLIGSRTFGGTILTQIRLWPLTFLSLGLVLIWFISPIGSQAALRMLGTTANELPFSANITYSNMRQSSYSGDPLFPISLIYPRMRMGGEIFQQVILRLISLHFFGIPVAGIPPGNSTFNIESTYLELTCSSLTSNITRTSSSNSSPQFLNPGLISTNGPFLSATNVTADTLWAMGYLGADISSLLGASFSSPAKTCLDCLPNNYTSEKLVPGTLLYQDFSGVSNVTSIYCVPSQTYIESLVACSKTSTTQSCSITSQRLSILQNQPAAITYLSFGPVINGLTQLLPQATQKISEVDIFQNYLVNPFSNTYIQSTPIPRFVSSTNTSNFSSPSNNESRLLTVPLQDFSTRLSQLINTFLQGSTLNSTTYLTSSSFFPIPQTSALQTNPSDLTSILATAPQTLTVPATLTRLIPFYAASLPWAAIFLLSTLFLLFSSILAAILRHYTLTRDYLPYVSSLVRESQFVTMPRGGVKMDGLERAREMRDLKVRMGDVGDVGAGWEVGTGVAVSVGQLAVMDWGGFDHLTKTALE
ncbi:hypothetical protein G7Y89_g8204 [Cudoniella acicularis]|uniref:Uncharacterized protein n=1 Tax=Cudoniella acicularis TaxID=354080 RepID=A0A8H4W329_9HELO|nr:hypothetical protein G7Y89_g8204 [Cudoniella acicularis]